MLVFEKYNLDRPDEWLGPEGGWYVNEYVGGYDDWAARRLQPPAATRPAAQSLAPAASSAPTPRRLTMKEKAELESLPGHIEALEAEQAQWHAHMADPSFFKKPAAEISQAKARIGALGPELETAYRHWEKLEALAKASAARQRA